MKYTKLGKSDLNVSRICMGCMGFGDAANGQHSWTIDEAATREIIKYGLEKGINFYDTAIAYQNGTSEQYVGRALRDFAKRDEIVVATKFLPRNQEELDLNVSGQKHVESSLNQSLKNLGMDCVDLYIYHIWHRYQKNRLVFSMSRLSRVAATTGMCIMQTKAADRFSYVKYSNILN